MPQLLSECPAAGSQLHWESYLSAPYLLSELGGAGCGRQGYFSPTSFGSLVATLNHNLSRCKTTGPKDRDEGSHCPGQLYYLNPFHKLIALTINEVKKGAVPGGQETPTDSSWVERLDDCQYCQVLSVSWVKRNCFCLSEVDLKAVQQNGHHQKTTKSELHLPSSSFYSRQAFQALLFPYGYQEKWGLWCGYLLVQN